MLPKDLWVRKSPEKKEQNSRAKKGATENRVITNMEHTQETSQPSRKVERSWELWAHGGYPEDDRLKHQTFYIPRARVRCLLIYADLAF